MNSGESIVLRRSSLGTRRAKLRTLHSALQREGLAEAPPLSARDLVGERELTDPLCCLDRWGQPMASPTVSVDLEGRSGSAGGW